MQIWTSWAHFDGIKVYIRLLPCNPLVAWWLQDATYTEPTGKDVTLPDDVMRTKSLVLHPVTVEEAVGELELVTSIALQ